MNKSDPLSSLLLDASESVRQRLSDVLANILGIDKDSGRIVPKSRFERLNSRNKLLAFLLGKKAAMLLKRADEEVVAPKDVTAQTGMPAGTVNPKLRELLSENVISQKNSGGYYISSDQLAGAFEILEMEEKKNSPGPD